ncbi:MAG: permease, partial [Methanosarcinales archaeon]|nr:permease [Methanosarcinales archaeon]
MNPTIIFINLFALGCLILAFTKDRAKTKQSVKVAAKEFLSILPTVLIIITFIGLLLGFVPPGEISKVIGEQSGFSGVLFIAVLGAILHIPAFMSFPLAGSLLKSGASISAVAAFITTLTMVGTATLPLEIKELGKKMALLRNGISFII